MKLENHKLTYFDLLHAIKAAGNVADDERVIVFGSNAILPWVNQSMKFQNSLDVDLTFFDDETGVKTDLVDGNLGESSGFHQTFGFWVHGVQVEESYFPANWRSRLVEIDEDYLEGKTGYVLSPPDLAAVKLAAGRDKDLQFVILMLSYEITDEESIKEMIALLPKKKAIASHNLNLCIRNIDSGLSL